MTMFQAIFEKLLRAWADRSPDGSGDHLSEAPPRPRLPLQADGGQGQDGRPRAQDAAPG